MWASDLIGKRVLAGQGKGWLNHPASGPGDVAWKAITGRSDHVIISARRSGW